MDKDKDKDLDKENENMEDILKTDETDINEYPDHMKTHPEAEKEIPGETPMEENLEQDPQPYKDYPDNLKTKPEE